MTNSNNDSHRSAASSIQSPHQQTSCLTHSEGCRCSLKNSLCSPDLPSAIQHHYEGSSHHWNSGPALKSLMSISTAGTSQLHSPECAADPPTSPNLSGNVWLHFVSFDICDLPLQKLEKAN